MMENKQFPCTDIQEAFLKHGFPLNMYLYRRKNSAVENEEENCYEAELHCVQSLQEVPVYRVIDENGKERVIHCNSFSHAYYTGIKPDLMFNSLSEINAYFCAAKKQKKTEKCSRWVVCMKTEPSSEGGILLRRGQVFKLISYKDTSGSLSCNKNISCRRKRAKILLYGSREAFWIPHNFQGQFRLCETNPGIGKDKRDDMSNIVQKHDFPILIRESENTPSFQCLIDVTTEKYIISCTESRQIIVFPARNVLLRHVLQSLPPVSSLSQQELQSVETKVFSNKYFEEEHYTGTFKEFGIFRKPELGLPSLPRNPPVAANNQKMDKPLPPVPVADYPRKISGAESVVKPNPSLKPNGSRKTGGEKMPPVPKRHPRHSLKLAKLKTNYKQITNNNVNNHSDRKIYKHYLCTPILNDPYDTDPDENDGDNCDELDQANQDGDSFDSDDYDMDDYENQPRIRMHELAKSRTQFTSQKKLQAPWIY